MNYKIKPDATNITVHLTREIAKKMRKYPEVTWSIVARTAIEKYCNNREKGKTTDVDQKEDENNANNNDENNE